MKFWPKFERREPYKYSENFVLWKYFLQNYLFHSSKEVFLHNFRQFLEKWIFDRNSTDADITKIVKIFYYLKLCAENIFWLNYLFDSSKEVFLHNFRQFLENWNFDRNSTGADLTNIVKILYYLTLCFENIFWLNYLFHSSKEVFLHNFRQFLENWNFDRNSTGADLTNIVKILYSHIVLWKYFLAKLFVLLIKGSVFPQF